ncbi:hypothetical protein VNO77_08406 [Canavalia gladiata]|uniref:Uncharacterized protein n=1 Tax=Canavalia gladiata TaxID=3824 RepID=A0AAN9QWL1_CANGL
MVMSPYGYPCAWVTSHRSHSFLAPSDQHIMVQNIRTFIRRWQHHGSQRSHHWYLGKFPILLSILLVNMQLPLPLCQRLPRPCQNSMLIAWRSAIECLTTRDPLTSTSTMSLLLFPVMALHTRAATKGNLPYNSDPLGAMHG